MTGNFTMFEEDLPVEQSTAIDVDWAKVAFSILICVAGLIGNTMTIFVIVILREYKKSVTHWYVLQLAVADTIFLLTLPFKANEDMVNEWQYPVWMCKAKESILFLNYYASILFLMIMSVDRYIAVCHTFSEFLQKFRRQFAASVITAATWLIALLLCTPFAMYSTKSGEQPNCKCEYEFTLAPEPQNWTESCLEKGLPADFVEFCVEYTKKQEPESSFCRSPNMRKDLWNKFQDSLDPEEEDSGSTFDIFLPGFDIFDYDFGGEGNDTSLNYTDGMDFGFGNLSGSGFSPFPSTSGAGLVEAVKPCDYRGTTPTWIGIIYFNFFGMFLIPLLVMMSSYGLIILRLRNTRVKSNLPQAQKSTTQKSTKSRASLASLGASGRKKQLRKVSSKSDRDRRRVTIMCATLVLSFTLCWVLFHATHLAKIVGIRVPRGHDKYCYTLGAVGALLGYLNSALNPYLYSFLGTSFSRRWAEATTKFNSSVRGGRSSIAYPFAGSKRHKSRGGDAISQSATHRMKLTHMVSEAGGGGSQKSRCPPTNVSMGEHRATRPL